MGKVTEKYEENKTQGEIHTVQCAECKRETRHKVIQSLDYSGSEVFNGGQYSIDWSANHQIIQCHASLTLNYLMIGQQIIK